MAMGYCFWVETELAADSLGEVKFLPQFFIWRNGNDNDDDDCFFQT